MQNSKYHKTPQETLSCWRWSLIVWIHFISHYKYSSVVTKQSICHEDTATKWNSYSPQDSSEVWNAHILVQNDWKRDYTTQMREPELCCAHLEPVYIGISQDINPIPGLYLNVACTSSPKLVHKTASLWDIGFFFCFFFFFLNCSIYKRTYPCMKTIKTNSIFRDAFFFFVARKTTKENERFGVYTQQGEDWFSKMTIIKMR